MKHKFLYRALRKLEIESDYTLIPKEFSNEEFTSDPRFGIDTTFPFKFGSVDNKVRQHQWKQDGLPTRGISTTPFFERAEFYGQRNRIIAKIDSQLFEKYGIETFEVNETLGFRPSDIAVMEDNEIILTYNKSGAFPKDLIVELINLDESKNEG
jgi:hypothetical protein